MIPAVVWPSLLPVRQSEEMIPAEFQLQVHLYRSTCLSTGRASNRAVTARLLSCMAGDSYIYKGHVHIYICRYTSHLQISNIYFLCIKQNHLHERQSEEMIPAVVGHSTKWGVLDPAGLGAGEWGVQAIVGWQALPPPIMGGILLTL